jgi:hypothetical protein
MPVLRATALTVRWGNVDTPTDPVSQTGSLTSPTVAQCTLRTKRTAKGPSPESPS